MNTSKPILDASGRRLFGVGGSQAWRTHDAGDYIVSLEWVDAEPAMVIWSKRGNDFAFAICLSSIGKYATPEGKPNQEGVNELAKALPDFGRAIERTELHHLVDVVLRYTSELIAMPPAPLEVFQSSLPEPILELTAKDERGKVMHEVSI